MFRFILTAFAIVPFCYAQNLPAYRWTTEVDGSGTDSFAGLGVDAQGNTYLAGSTYSTSFPVKNAVQNHLASAGLYSIDGPGSAYARLGLASASFVAVDPQNPITIYAVAYGPLMKSTDGGATFALSQTLPSAHVFSIAINPVNDQMLYVGTEDQGLLKSTDGGVTWTASNGKLQGSQGQFYVLGIWIDPSSPNVILANINGNLVRSGDAGASWQTLFAPADITGVTFDTANPGVVYAPALDGLTVFKSADHGQTFVTVKTPTNFAAILPDPNHSGRLLGLGGSGVYESDDNGATWTQKLNTPLVGTAQLIAADWASGYIYAVQQPSTVVRISADLKTVTPVGPPSLGSAGALAAANGHAYAAALGSRDVYVTKLDPAGNVVYSTYFGGSADDVAIAMAVDRSGNIYVAGTTASLDFPVSKGAYASTGSSFLFRLNPDGLIGYSTYFTGATPAAVAVDASGSAYMAGSSRGNLPVTPGAYQTDCNCNSFSTGFLTVFVESGFLTKFDPTGSSLVYSTYIGGTAEFAGAVNTLALASDGSAYVGGSNGISHLNATGSAVLASVPAYITPIAMAVAPDGGLYVAGPPGNGSNPLKTTAGAFEPVPGPPTNLAQGTQIGEAAIAKLDQGLGIVVATYFGGSYDQIQAMTLDSAGNVYIGGNTAPQGLPTRTPLQGGFSVTTGFLAELSGDLSTLLFSSYFGDNEHFNIEGVGVAATGQVVFGGNTGMMNYYGSGLMNIWVNSLTLGPPPSLRIDAVENAASLLDGPVSGGETIVVQGTGFGSDAQLLIGGASVPTISITANTITAVIPANVPDTAAEFQVKSGAAASNPVLVPVGVTSPGIFSQNGLGYGQGYILNKDGTLNTPSNPATPGDKITIYTTGVGPVSFTNGYAETQFPVSVLVDGFYCAGVAAVMRPVPGFPGSVYQITVTIPIPSNYASGNPNLQNFAYPPLVSVTMQIDGASSQAGLYISIAQ